jgi:hypothetical protein
VSRKERGKRDDSSDDSLTEAQRQADEAHRKLQEAEHRAEETLKHAADDLAELTKEQESNAERLRRESKRGSTPQEEAK